MLSILKLLLDAMNCFPEAESRVHPFLQNVYGFPSDHRLYCKGFSIDAVPR